MINHVPGGQRPRTSIQCHRQGLRSRHSVRSTCSTAGQKDIQISTRNDSAAGKGRRGRFRFISRSLHHQYRVCIIPTDVCIIGRLKGREMNRTDGRSVGPSSASSAARTVRPFGAVQYGTCTYCMYSTSPWHDRGRC
jgi:hypothetical protein